VFNKRTLCVEESLHVLFDKSNSLSENDAQEEDFELGLAKKELGSMHEKGKSHSEGSEPEPGLKKKGTMTNKQGKQLLNPVCNRTRIVTRKQAPEQLCKQALVQTQEQDPKLMQ